MIPNTIVFLFINAELYRRNPAVGFPQHFTPHLGVSGLFLVKLWIPEITVSDFFAIDAVLDMLTLDMLTSTKREVQLHYCLSNKQMLYCT